MEIADEQNLSLFPDSKILIFNDTLCQGALSPFQKSSLSNMNLRIVLLVGIKVPIGALMEEQKR